MKKILFICILLVFNYKAIAQKSTYSQAETFQKGLLYLKDGKLERAFSFFNMANSFGENDEIKALAFHKIDSLLPIIRKNVLKQWKGNWKLKELNYNPFPGSFPDYISFDNDRIVFYKKDSLGNKIITRTEFFRFTSYDPSKSNFDVRKVVFKNEEIWSFTVIKKNRKLRLYPELIRDSIGRRKVLIDERGMIMDKKLRKKELKKEIYTFYLKDN